MQAWRTASEQHIVDVGDPYVACNNRQLDAEEVRYAVAAAEVQARTEARVVAADNAALVELVVGNALAAKQALERAKFALGHRHVAVGMDAAAHVCLLWLSVLSGAPGSVLASVLPILRKAIDRAVSVPRRRMVRLRQC